MDRFMKILLAAITLYLLTNAFILMFLYESYPIAPQIAEWTLEEMAEYRARIIIPAFFLTLVYFIFRYFSGKNPTSALWPIYVALVSFMFTQIIGIMVFLPLSFDVAIMFFLTIIMLIVTGKAHHRRKKEIF